MVAKTLSIGAVAPAFKNLPGVDGKNYSLEDFSNSKILVVVFSCNHCPYVKAYEDRMIAFQTDYAPRSVQLVAINSNETRNYPDDNFDEMVKRARVKRFNFPYLRDEDQTVADVFGATHTPEFFVFNDSAGAERRLAYHGKMDDDYQDPTAIKRRYLCEAVDAILAGQSVAEPETHSIGCTIKWKY
jgi:thiol-disulfide isomerase/thioredoxin